MVHCVNEKYVCSIQPDVSKEWICGDRSLAAPTFEVHMMLLLDVMALAVSRGEGRAGCPLHLGQPDRLLVIELTG